MTQIFAAPGRYIQGYQELQRLYRHIAWFGQRFLVITTQGRLESLRQTLALSFDSPDLSLHYAVFDGEVTRAEVQRLHQLQQTLACDGVIGVGGGKVLDAAKAVAARARLPLCIVPTVVSNDAPTSALSVLYHAEGGFDDVLFHERSPDVVVVDTHVIAQAPVRLLVAGIGDALATYYEARTCVQGQHDNFLGLAGGGLQSTAGGGKPTLTSMAIAELCHRVLCEDAVQAVRACERNVVTKALNRVIEANALMSGIGFESNGVASAHAVYCGFSELGVRATAFHGEYVAFGTVVMLVLEGAPAQELDALLRLCLAVGLPVCLADLGLADISDHELQRVAEVAASPQQTSRVEPFEVTTWEMRAALLAASDLGEFYKKGGSVLTTSGGQCPASATSRG
ncbi:glycerol dehydrogenase [Pseudomonas sp. Teo4]|uniref:glycerol dehydrogenase n=1 Tax=Pseudomonas sp. Teo4 TaxID=3064528 RepID=UPI002ABC5C2C|nr:glycerol dehydrogenase [Pseudomonas sp. Teo4]MDZ3992529.1 Glycerol dehydrogenase [Pseudomonas sp. Teo4]